MVVVSAADDGRENGNSVLLMPASRNASTNSTAPTSTEVFLDALRAVVGAEHVVVDRLRQAPFLTDWTGRFVGSTPAVVRPASVDDVARVLRVCLHAGAPWVPQGGNTGLVGGGVPVDGEIVVATTRLDSLGEVDLASGQVIVGAGVTLAAVQRHARAAGWRFGVDFGAREQATIGGMVATNAGGNAVLRFGMMAEQVVGIEAVLPDGSVVRRLSGLAKDNTGYNLAGLLCGSEGTLGLITAVRLRLRPAVGEVATVALGVASITDALAVLGAVRGVESVEACELMRSIDIAALCEARGWRQPTPWEAPWALLIEASGSGSLDALSAVLATVSSHLVGDPAVADRPSVRDAWWAIRDGQGEVARQFGSVVKLDVSVPHGLMAAFVDTIDERVATVAPGARLVVFGHLGDANLHVNVGARPASFGAIETLVLGAVLALGGSISAEHGIGRAKREWLVADRGPEAVAAMRAVKHALDPANLANPQVLFGSDKQQAPGAR